MKKYLAFILTLIIFTQVGATAFAFTDTVANSFTNKKYNHDDKFANHEILHGVDVSYWQSTADFKKVKAAGADFVFLRAAYRGSSKGNLVKDTKFEEYAKAADKAGLDIGAYIYSQAISVKEAQEEANFIINIVKNYNITLPLVLDFEYASDSSDGGRLYKAKLTNSQRTEICIAFCKKIEDSGYTAMVYANQSMLVDNLNDDEIAKDYDIWLANYSTSPKYASKLYDCDYSYWQYSSSGKVNGLPGNVDCNFRYFKKPLKLKGLEIVEESAAGTTLKWQKSKGCYGYEIFKLDPTTNKYVKIGTTKGASNTSFTDTNSMGLQNTYKVRAISAYKKGFKVGTCTTPLTTKGVFMINVNSSGTGFATFSWQSVENADSYEVLRSAEENGIYTSIATLDSQTLHFTDLTKSGFKTYYYKIKAIFNDDNGNPQSVEYSPVTKIVKQQPSLKTTYLKKNTQVQIEWNTVEGATASAIYRSADGKEFKRIKTINNNTTSSYVDKTCKKGVKYIYKVRQIVNVDGTNYYSDYTKSKTIVTLKTPVITLNAAKKSVKLSYDKVKTAKGYEIYMKTAGGKYQLIRTTIKKTFTKKKLTPNKKYYIKVRPYKIVNDKKIYGSFSKVKSAKPY